ncbi:MAG: cupin domain-containing protein [Bacteroidetes bacterium]|nr:cupin domain-containing protein [Bacteroidota bacterium]
MIRTAKNMRIEERDNMRSGPGRVVIQHIVEKEQLRHARLFSEITLQPKDGIGPHTHTGETEYYYILEGTGKVIEDDGEKMVAAGDVVITGNGESHSITNTGDVTLKLIAVIILD